MTVQSRLQARIDFEREMTEYYEAAGLDRQAERSRNLAAELADEAAELASADRQPGRELWAIGPCDRPEPEPEPEAEI